jgi:GAF domain-containing protein
MGLERNQPHGPAGTQNPPVRGEHAIAGSEDVSHLLDAAAGDDVRALRAALKVSQAVLGAHRLNDALEVIAEQTRAALGAGSFSISRWERERGVLRTMINVGELGPGEERWPTDEEYSLADYRDVTELLGQGRPYATTLDDDDIDPAVEALLRRLKKYSELAVPVMYQGAMWGELWATGADRRCFGPDDVRLLQAIAAQISVAIGASELFS